MTRKIWMLANLIKRCPKCGYRLVRSRSHNHHFDCPLCDRGWKIDFWNGVLIAMFDAAPVSVPLETFGVKL